jgi:signal transduction histidine kinase
MTFWAINYAAMIFSAVLTALIGIYAWMHRQERGALFLAWIMLFDTLNACGSILERASGTVEWKLFWFNFHESAYILMMPFFLFFVLEYANLDALLKLKAKASILLYFLLWALFLWTDSFHHLLRQDLTVQDRVLMFASTDLSLGLNIIGFLSVFAALCCMSVYVGKSGPLARKQALWVWLSAALPILWVIFGFVHPLPPAVRGVYTTVINVAMGLCMFMAIFRYKLFSVVPIAKDQIVEMMQDGVLVVNGKGTVIDCNPSAHRLFEEWAGHPTEMTGANIQQLLAPWPRWREACEGGLQDEFEIEFGEGRQARVFTVKTLPLASPGKRKLGTVSILSDNTEDHRRYEQAERMNRYKDDLFGIVTHDIRDPLAILLSLTDMLDGERSRFSADSAEVLDIVRAKAEATFEMVENLLDWVRCQRGGISLHPQPTPLSLLVREVASLLENKRAAKQIDLQNDVHEEIRVYADREAVRLVLRNLLANAIKYTRQGGSVSIGAEENGGTVTVAVKDNGIGMAPERVNMLFGDLPLQSVPGTAGEHGTGMGLLLCKELVRHSGGEIGASSVPDEGTVITFSLPSAVPLGYLIVQRRPKGLSRHRRAIGPF